MIRPIHSKDKEIVVEILTKAFSENKSVDFVTSKSVKKRKLLMEYAFDKYFNSEVSFFDPDSKGVVLAYYPHLERISLKSMLKDVRFAFQVPGISKIKSVLQRESYIHHQHGKKQYIHLLFLGIDPSEQGRGTGSEILKEVQKIAVQKRLEIFLETSTLKNLKFYQKNNFRCFHEWNDPKYGFTLYFFRFDPCYPAIVGGT